MIDVNGESSAIEIVSQRKAEVLYELKKAIHLKVSVDGGEIIGADVEVELVPGRNYGRRDARQADLR